MQSQFQIDCLLKKNNKLFIESYLEECLYKDWYEH